MKEKRSRTQFGQRDTAEKHTRMERLAASAPETLGGRSKPGLTDTTVMAAERNFQPEG